MTTEYTMKDLSFNALKGTKTVIHCSTLEEWDKVVEICGYEWSGSQRCGWAEYTNKVCIYLIN